MPYNPRVPLTFVVGSASAVFGPALAGAVAGVLRARFPAMPGGDADAYRSEPVEFAGWRELTGRVVSALGEARQLTGVEPYQAVFLREATGIETLAIPDAADPLQVASLDGLLDELRRFAAIMDLPTDDVELMELAARYLEEDLLLDADLDVQTYVQLMLSAKQAAARGEPLWVVA
jgi:hypothetical protein